MTKTLFVAAFVAGIALTIATANAQERIGDGVMGAVAGALVGGPIGAVAGGAIGYTEGPHISRGMGLHHHHRYVRHAVPQHN